MTGVSKRLLFWTPRLISIVFIAFLSLFALDVFDGQQGFWQTMLAFVIHEIPALALLAVLVLAWRWEWVGAALYLIAGLLYIAWVLSMGRPVSLEMRFVWILTIAGPAFLIAILFWANWRRHAELHR